MHRITLIFFYFLFVLIPNAYTSFTHPGLLVTNSDIDRAKSKIDAKMDPWLSSWNKLTSIKYSSASYASQAVPSIDRPKNGELLWQDTAATFDLALRWKISGDTQYADASARILADWASKFKSLDGGDDKYLSAGLQGYELANAAELLRDYPPFSENDLASVIRMLTTVILPLNIKFLNHGEPSEHNHRHFFANWELSNVASTMAIAVLTDNQTTWDFAINYFKNGTGNGAIENAITNIVWEPETERWLGQGQEAGRGQGYAGLDIQLLGVIGQQAWNQREDLFGYDNNRILLNAEYYARYNLGGDVPFVHYEDGIHDFTIISNISRGAVRPTWELMYSHYAIVKGLEAPCTKLYRNHSLEAFKEIQHTPIGFEGGAGSWGEGSGHYDGLGWGSLIHRLEENGNGSKALCKTYPKALKKRHHRFVGFRRLLSGTRRH